MSPVFKTMLKGNMKETTTSTVEITDFPERAVQAFVHYLYYQDLPSDGVDKYSVDLWGLSDKYQVEVLQKHIVQLQTEFVPVINFIKLVTRAEALGAKDITDFCIDFMLKHKEAISKQEEGVRSLPHNLLVQYVLTNGSTGKWNGYSPFME